MVAAFGLVNAALILVAAAFSATALDAALAGAQRAGAGAPPVQLLYDLAGSTWDLGGLFFGLWLIPMGWLTVRSGLMPRALGWVLVAGGIGYVVSTYVSVVDPRLAGMGSVLTLPATVGELWMVAYLLWRGVRRDAGAVPRPAPA